MVFRSISYALAAFVGAGLCVNSARAADPQARVQLQVFMARAQAGAQIQEQPITVFINTTSKQASENVCALAPRVRDAITSKLVKSVYPVDKAGVIDTSLIGPDLSQPIRDTAKAENVMGVEVKPGGPKVKGAAATAFARTGCIGAVEASGEDDKKKVPAKKE